ncbi:Bug family tripartite tricarboxylate transporter substrate binding protein [Orrella marina]|uniref:Twin-arginine translocation pathway signal n=1 Tax=Orrella marina TaxID=2163011 RepID=A0A2R4XH41_9BURK|nr:tripartite tricarboxylate transporter substrate binding protein [Orrella marina]AWB33111.1 Twin-arginine translocation pathway signal [Orrella marina]
MNKPSLHKLSAVALLTGAMAMSIAPAPVSAQKAPFENATMMVGFSAGGGTDTTTRTVANQVGLDNEGLAIAVLNRPGAGGVVAQQSLLTAPKDGSTIMLTSVGPLTVLPHLSKVGFDVKQDFVPISMAVNFPNILVVPSSLGVKTFDEFIEYAKKNPGKVNYGSSGIGAASHMAGEMLNQRAGIDMLHIPYKGGAPAMNDLITGRVDAYFGVPSSVKPHIESGALIPIASSGETRSIHYPDIPALGELYPGFNATNWYAFIGPAGMPPETVQWWNQAIVKALKNPDVQERLSKVGLDIETSTPEELARIIDSESQMWSAIIQERGIKLN